MITHYIIISSSYLDGTRIALDITGNPNIKPKTIKTTIQKIKQACGKSTPLSTHTITTSDATWESVKTYDPYFDNIKPIDTLSEFIDIINRNRVLSDLDIIQYILAKYPYTTPNIQHILKKANDDYIKHYQKPLFEKSTQKHVR